MSSIDTLSNCTGLDKKKKVPIRPYKGTEEYIFISYSHKDEEKVLRIISAMIQHGFRVWFDEGIDPGTEWAEIIAEHIAESGYFISFMSENYLQSENCKDEITIARDLNKPRLLVYLSDVVLPLGMAMRLNRLQAIHYYKYPTFESFLKKLYESEGIDSFRSQTFSFDLIPSTLVDSDVVDLCRKFVDQDSDSLFLLVTGQNYKANSFIMRAIRDSLIERKLDALYLQMDEFTDDLCSALREGVGFREFRKPYERVDILVLEAFNCIAGKEITQEEVYMLLKYRYYNSKATMIVCPKDLSFYAFSEDIVSLINEWKKIIIEEASDKNMPLSTRENDRQKRTSKEFAQKLRVSSSEERKQEKTVALVSDEGNHKTENSNSDFFIEVDDEFFYMTAVEFEKGKNELDAVQDYQSAADLGNSKAQVALGVHYFMGDFASIGVNYEVSKMLFEKAAQQGDKYAQYNLGVCYETGMGVDENLEEAFIWYQKSANQGLPVAQKKLAECYYCWSNVPPNFTQTVIWLTSAINNDDDNDRMDIPSFIVDPTKSSNIKRKQHFFMLLGYGPGPETGNSDFENFDLLSDASLADKIISNCLHLIYSDCEKIEDWAYLRELADKENNVSLQYYLAELYLSYSKYNRGFLISEKEINYLINAAHYLQSAAEQGHSQAAETYKQLSCDKRTSKILKKWGFS